MKILFVRHAESTSNVAGLWQGHGDAPLSAGGREQARALGRRLARQSFDLIVSSDLSRAHDTARALGRPVEADPAWRELDVGAWEGLTRRQVAERFPEELEALRRGELVQVGGGESWLDLWQRADTALSRLRARLGEHGRAVVMTHGGVIHGIVAGLLGLRYRHPRPVGRVANTAMTVLGFGDQGAELSVFNDATHLSPLGPWAHERLDSGDAVVTLIAPHDRPHREVPEAEDRAPAPSPPHAPGPPATLDGWYAGLEHLYAPAHLRQAGTSLAATLGVPLRAPRWDDGGSGVELPGILRTLADTHPGSRIGLMVPGKAVTQLATELACDSTATRGRFGGLRSARVCHLVVGNQATTFADYNVGPGDPC